MATRTILVVDDEPGIVAIARDYLDRAGFRVITAGDGAAALRLARAERPSLLVLDLMLPGMDGLDVARALREDPATHMLPIIMLTARVEEADRLIGLELGADDYITKPFSPRELVARVRAVLRRLHCRIISRRTPYTTPGRGPLHHSGLPMVFTFMPKALAMWTNMSLWKASLQSTSLPRLVK